METSRWCTWARLLGVVAVATTLVTAGAAASAFAAGAAKPQQGGLLRLASNTDPPGMDVTQLAAIPSQTPAIVATGIYDMLVYVDPTNLKLVPRIATSLTTTDGGLTWTLKLRPGVRFSDGTVLDAEAVRFNWVRIADPANRAPTAQVAAQIQTSEVLDPSTLKVTLKAADANWSAKVARSLSSIGSPTAIKALGTGFATQPVGAGPYLLKEWVRGDHYTLVRNPNYWQKGLPNLDQINVITNLTDDTQRYNTMISGSLDVTLEGTPQNIEQAKATKKFNFFPTPDLGGGNGIGFNVSKPPFNDVRLRQALSLVLDSKELGERSGTASDGTLMKTIDQPGTPFYDPRVRLSKSDPVAAQKLIDQIVAEQGGKPVSFTLDVLAVGYFPRQADTVQAMVTSKLKNVEVKLNPLASAEVVRRYTVGDFQATQVGVRWQDPTFDLATAFMTNSSLNYFRYSNPTVDAAINQLIAATDLKGKRAAERTILENVLKDVPFVWYFRPVITFIATKSVRNYDVFWNMRPLLDAVWLAEKKS